MGTKIICKSGCLLAVTSMALNDMNAKINGQEANPKTLNEWLKKHGSYSGNSINWGPLAELGLRYIDHVTKIDSIVGSR